MYSCGVHKHGQNFMYSGNPHGVSCMGVYSPELSWLFTKMDPYVTNNQSINQSINQPTNQPTNQPINQSINQPENKEILFMWTYVVPSVNIQK